MDSFSFFLLSFLTVLALCSATYIFVIDAFHEHQLSVCPLGVGLVLEGSAQLLDGYISVQDTIIARTVEEKKHSIQFSIHMWINLWVIAWHCDNPPWKSLVKKNKDYFSHILANKDSWKQMTDGFVWNFHSLNVTYSLSLRVAYQIQY